VKRNRLVFIGLASAFALLCSVSIPEIFATDLSALEQTDPLPPESLPVSASFYSAQNPNAPPMPFNPLGLSAWDLGNGQYELAWA